MAADDDFRGNIARMQLRANQVTDESLESTRHMLNLVEEAQDTGERTLAMLDGQGEQLDRIDGGMGQINQNMKQADKNLDGLEECCGLCICPWNTVKIFKQDSEYIKAFSGSDEKMAISDQPKSSTPDEPTMGQVGGGFVRRVTNDAREDEMDENLSQVSAVLGNLKHMALDMSNEITSQNKQIEGITVKADANIISIDSGIKRASKNL